MWRLTLWPGLLAGVVAAWAVAGEAAKTEKQTAKDVAPSRAAFERLKKLVGDWQVENPKDQALQGKTVARYRLSAGDSVVVETLFPGTPKEMVTVYHRDGDQLMLTHYCHCGNQPRMRARVGSEPDQLVFEFAGGTNLDPAKDMHMHNMELRFVDADHVHSDWELYVDGKSAGKHGLDLVRQK
jgi:hypothetical protein